MRRLSGSAKSSGIRDIRILKLMQQKMYYQETDTSIRDLSKMMILRRYAKDFLSEVNVLNRTLASLDTNELKVVAEKIEKAEKIVFFGSGGSLIVAKDAAHKFMKIGIRAFVYEDIDLQLMSSSLMNEKEVAIGISHSGSNRNVIDCIKNAKENGAETIAIVGQGKTPLSKIADMILYCSSEETMFESESVSTRIAQLAIIDAIVAIVAFDNYEESYTAIQRTRRATSENKY